jgi:hypothetical protein
MFYALGVRLLHEGALFDEWYRDKPIKMGLASWLARDLDSYRNPPYEVAHRARLNREYPWRVIREFDIDEAEARAIAARFAPHRMPGPSRVRYYAHPEVIEFVLTDPRGREWSGKDGAALGVISAHPDAPRIDNARLAAGAAFGARIGLGDRLRKRRESR